MEGLESDSPSASPREAVIQVWARLWAAVAILFA